MRHFPALLPRLLGLLLVALLLLASRLAPAHPMLTSRVLPGMQARGVAAEVPLSLSELQLAPGQQLNMLTTPAYLLPMLSGDCPSAAASGWWPCVSDAEQTNSGSHQELTARLWLQPPPKPAPAS